MVELRRTTKRKARAESNVDIEVASQSQHTDNVLRMPEDGSNNRSKSQSSFLWKPLQRLTKSNRGDGDDDMNEESDQAAASGLGQMSKIKISQEGCASVRVYSEAGSVSAFVGGSEACWGKELGEYFAHAKASDTRSVTRLANFTGITDLHTRGIPLPNSLAEFQNRLPPANLCHMLLDRYFESMVFSLSHRAFPRATLQRAYDALWTNAEERDEGRNAQAARGRDLPQSASPCSLAFLSLIFGILASGLFIWENISSSLKGPS